MAIRLMRAADVPETPRDRLYRASRARAVIAVLVCLGLCALILYRRWPAPRVSYFISAAIILLLLALNRFVTARFHPANWLVRIGDEGLFLHLRSYLNDHLPAEDPTVAFVAFSDIRSARLLRERVETRNADNSAQYQYVRYVEFELAVDPAPLVNAIATECGRSAVPEKRWYGTSSTLYRDYPVLMQSPPFLRVKWEAVPSATSFLEAIRQRVPIAEPIKLRDDLANLQNLGRQQQDEQLRRLDQRGDTMTAVYMARKLYSFDLTAAVNYVNALRGTSQ